SLGERGLRPGEVAPLLQERTEAEESVLVSRPHGDRSAEGPFRVREPPLALLHAPLPGPGVEVLRVALRRARVFLEREREPSLLRGDPPEVVVRLGAPGRGPDRLRE